METSEIKQTRQRLGLTQQQLADELRVHRATVVAWEAGRQPANPHTIRLALERLAERQERR
jgi:DNA-binding transcriptional regulator YiaG